MLVLSVVGSPFESSVEDTSTCLFWGEVGNVQQEDGDQSLGDVQIKDWSDITGGLVEPAREEVDDAEYR